MAIDNFCTTKPIMIIYQPDERRRETEGETFKHCRKDCISTVDVSTTVVI